MDEKFSFLTKIAAEPSNLIKGLQAIQAAEGYVSNDAINAAVMNSRWNTNNPYTGFEVYSTEENAVHARQILEKMLH